MPYIYLLKSQKDNRTYIGSTTDLKHRIKEHNSGSVHATRHRRPLVLIYLEEIATIEQARKKEQYLKSAAGRRWMKKMVFNNGE